MVRRCAFILIIPILGCHPAVTSPRAVCDCPNVVENAKDKRVDAHMQAGGISDSQQPENAEADADIESSQETTDILNIDDVTCHLLGPNVVAQEDLQYLAEMGHPYCSTSKEMPVSEELWEEGDPCLHFFDFVPRIIKYTQEELSELERFRPFMMTWKINEDNADVPLQIIPREPYLCYRFKIRFQYDCGDGKGYRDANNSVSCHYDKKGVYQIKIRGELPELHLIDNSKFNILKDLAIDESEYGRWSSGWIRETYNSAFMNLSRKDEKKRREIEWDDGSTSWEKHVNEVFPPDSDVTLLSIDQWGDIEWESMGAFCIGCKSMQLKAKDAPKLRRWAAMSYAFIGAEKLNAPLNHWDVSNVSDMSYFLAGAKSFNQPLDKWNLVNLEYAQAAFRNAESFDQDLSEWNICIHVSTAYMFYNSGISKRNIPNWPAFKLDRMIIHNYTEEIPINECAIKSDTPIEGFSKHAVCK